MRPTFEVCLSFTGACDQFWAALWPVQKAIVAFWSIADHMHNQTVLRLIHDSADEVRKGDPDTIWLLNIFTWTEQYYWVLLVMQTILLIQVLLVIHSHIRLYPPSINSCLWTSLLKSSAANLAGNWRSPILISSASVSNPIITRYFLDNSLKHSAKSLSLKTRFPNQHARAGLLLFAGMNNSELKASHSVLFRLSIFPVQFNLAVRSMIHVPIVVAEVTRTGGWTASLLYSTSPAI